MEEKDIVEKIGRHALIKLRLEAKKNYDRPPALINDYHNVKHALKLTEGVESNWYLRECCHDNRSKIEEREKEIYKKIYDAVTDSIILVFAEEITEKILSQEIKL